MCMKSFLLVAALLAALASAGPANEVCKADRMQGSRRRLLRPGPIRLFPLRHAHHCFRVQLCAGYLLCCLQRFIVEKIGSPVHGAYEHSNLCCGHLCCLVLYRTMS
ncbi:hypothetical protein B0H21DRAFT_198045 [Amylocystis lapponica]|nr:hypothetical protein B0H21DRAFT_198045 [Amylocystis lapponica]